MYIDVICSLSFGLLLGVCIFYLFICNTKYNTIYRGPNSGIVKKQIFRHNNKCYVFEPRIYICPTRQKLI